jgi:hypothetical protein
VPLLQVARDVMVAVLPVLRYAAPHGALREGREGITACTSSTKPPHHAEEVNMKIADLREGDLLAEGYLCDQANRSVRVVFVRMGRNLLRRGHPELPERPSPRGAQAL